MKVESKSFMVLPCKKDVCQECAVKHHPNDPHNQQSLYYKYKFFEKNKRWPTWKDAMFHCAKDVQELWTKELRGKGVTV